MRSEQAAFSKVLQAAAATLLEKKQFPPRREVLKLAEKVERLRSATENLQAVSLKEIQVYNGVISRMRPGRPAAEVVAALERMRHLEAALAMANRLVIEVRTDAPENPETLDDPMLRELLQWYDESMTNLGKAVDALKRILATQRATLTRELG